MLASVRIIGCRGMQVPGDPMSRLPTVPDLGTSIGEHPQPHSSKAVYQGLHSHREATVNFNAELAVARHRPAANRSPCSP